MNEININEIVKIEQMPKVFSQLEKIGELIDKKTNDLDELKCTDENKQVVKNRRTEINKTLEVLEERRIEIKNKLLEPYKTFEEKYNNECKIKLQKASDLLKNKIDDIETKQKQEKENELRDFFKQHCIDKKLDSWLSYEMIAPNVTLSASMKSLKEQILNSLNQIEKDIQLIELEEYRDEILLKYQDILDFAYCKMCVIDEHKRLEEIQKQQEMKQEQEKQEEKVVEKVDEVIAPVEVIEDDELITVSFKVTGTKEQIKKIKELIIEMGIDYE